MKNKIRHGIKYKVVGDQLGALVATINLISGLKIDNWHRLTTVSATIFDNDLTNIAFLINKIIPWSTLVPNALDLIFKT